MIKTKLFICLLLVGNVLLSVSAVFAQENLPRIELKSSQLVAEKGDVIDVDVWLADGVDVYGGQVSLDL